MGEISIHQLLCRLLCYVIKNAKAKLAICIYVATWTRPYAMLPHICVPVFVLGVCSISDTYWSQHKLVRWTPDHLITLICNHLLVSVCFR